MKKNVVKLFSPLFVVATLAITSSIIACSKEEEQDIVEKIIDSAESTSFDDYLDDEGYAIGSFSWSDLSKECSFLNKFSAISIKAVGYKYQGGKFIIIYDDFPVNRIKSYIDTAKSAGFSSTSSTANDGTFTATLIKRLANNYSMSIVYKTLDKFGKKTIVTVRK